MFRPFELFVGARYVRAQRGNHFVSFISWISMLGIAIGVAALIVVLSVMNGFEKEFRERILSTAAHATIEGYEGPVRDWRRVRDGALAHDQVMAAAPFVGGQGMLATDAAIAGVLVRGVVPEAESTVSGIAGQISAGRFDALTPGGWGIVVGVRLAEKLSLGLGDKAVLMIPEGNVTPAGVVPRMRRFTVVGIFDADMHEYDSGLAYVHMRDAAKLYRLGDGATGVRLTLHDMWQAPQIVREIAVDLGGGFYIGDWTRQHANFFRSIQLTKTVMFIMLLMVVGVAAFNIIATLVMVVTDKQADIAILRTVGATPRSVMGTFVVQGSFIGVVGTLLGLVLGVVLAWNAADLVALLEGFLNTQFIDASVSFIGSLPSDVQSGDLVTICTTALLLALLSTLYPAWQAARTEPAEALRYE